MKEELFYICEWCPEEYCGKRKEELSIVDGKRICQECIENEYTEEPLMEVFVPETDKRIKELEACVQNLMDTGDARIAELEAERDNWRTRHLEIARDYDKLRHLAHAVTNRLCWTDSTDTAPFSDYDEVNILKEYLDELMRAT
jgi:hypothetical protein